MSEHLKLLELDKTQASLAIDLQKKVIRPHVQEIIDAFYDYILEIPHFSHFLSSDNLIKGLKKTMRNYLMTLGLNFNRVTYFELRLRAGVAHVRIELPMMQYICIFNKLSLMLHQYLRQELDGDELVLIQTFLQKILSLDLSLVTESYYLSGINKLTEIIASEKGQEKTIKENANLDALTGMLSRKATMSMLQQVLADKKVKDISATIMMTDICQLELVNKKLGHAAGDYVVRKVADRIMKIAGKENAVGRFGGDKFIILVKDKKDAADMAHKISKDIHTRPVMYKEQPISLTICVGLTEIVKNDDLKVVFSRLDQAVHKAKDGKANNVIAHH